MQESTRQKLFQLFTDKINYINQRETSFQSEIKNLREKQKVIRDNFDNINDECKTLQLICNFIMREFPESDEKSNLLEDVDLHLKPLQDKWDSLDEEEKVITEKLTACRKLMNYESSDKIQYSSFIEYLNKLDS